MNEMQVTPVGLVARQPECLASPRRRSLPTHVALRLYFIGGAVGRHYFKGHPHKPETDWRERKFVGIKELWRRTCAPGSRQKPAPAALRLPTMSPRQGLVS